MLIWLRAANAEPLALKIFPQSLLLKDGGGATPLVRPHMRSAPAQCSLSAPTRSLDDWFTWRRFAGVLALLILAAFWDVLLNLSSFVYRDFGLFGYPLAHYLRESFWRGEVPLWNPLNNCGLPFLAQWNTLACYPGSLIYLVLPLPWSLNLFCLLHLFLAGVAMFFLAFRWLGNGLAASLAMAACIGASHKAAVTRSAKTIR